MKLKNNLLLFTLLNSSAFATVTNAETASLTVQKDSTIIDTGNVNGTGEGFFAGKPGNGSIQRSLIAFDIRSIPAEATIDNATLTLHVNAEGTAFPEAITLHKLNTNWNEAANGSGNANAGGGGGVMAIAGDATWTGSGFGAWTDGGDFNATVSATQTVNGLGFYNWTSPTLVADVQNWLDNGNNFGWIIRGNEAVNNSPKRFSSRENTGDAARIPVLTIDYTLPTPTATSKSSDSSSGAFSLVTIVTLSCIGLSRRKHHL